MTLAPIVLFIYNRPRHTQETLESLADNDLADKSILYIFADGPKENADIATLQKINETREVAKNKQWCKEIHLIESDKNKGLSNSVIDGVTNILNLYDKIIVLEDDLILSKGFLKYMNDALNIYKENSNIMQISGYCFPVKNITKKKSSFFIPMCSTWGWATWGRAWKNFDALASGYEKLKLDKDLEKKFNLDGSYPYSTMLIDQMESKKIDSWGIKWWWTIFKENGITLFPDKSLVKNIGFGDSATHTQSKDPFPINDFDPNYFINDFPKAPLINKSYFNQIKLYIGEMILKKAVESKKSRYPAFIKNLVNKLTGINIY